MVAVYGLDKVEKMAVAQKAIKDLNKKHYDRVVKQYIEAGVDKEVAKAMAKAMIGAKLA